MEINELEVIAHFLLLDDLIVGFEDLWFECCFLGFIFLNERIFLTQLLFKILDDPFRLYFSCSTILSTNKYFPLEIECIFPNFCDAHICFFEDGLILIMNLNYP
jgi:hypothetical protein